MSESLWGLGNGPREYLLVLLFYAMLFLLMRHGHERIPLSFRATYTYLFVGWSVGTFVANYLLYRAGVMSFLPWANNFCHTFIWIAGCLGFLYAGAHQKSFIEQFALFAIYSLLVKIAENAILGTWEHNNFFGIPGNTAYIIGWSLADGLYPLVSMVGLRIVARFDRAVAPALAKA
ncbi:MAG TPA: hypothetical protein VGD49_05585 [Longimicrobiales bacterium]